MARFHGVIGFVRYVESPADSGNWEPQTIERTYSGDVVRNIRRWEPGQSRNDDVSVNNSISIVANAFANANLARIRYVKWHGECWEVSSIDASQPPRLILTLGGVYNGTGKPTDPTTSSASEGRWNP